MRSILLLFFLFFSKVLFAQSNTITGVVIDADNNEIISGSSVFISNTGIGAITNDTTGRFILINIPWYNSLLLVVSRVGYQTFTYSFSANQLPLNLRISLHKKVVEMENVQVIPYEKDGWQKWGYIFLKQFLGDSENAYDCQVDNTNIIKFRHNIKEETLEAEADGILIIRNYHLNYLLRYQLEKFVYNFKTQRVSYSGYPLFQEMTPNEPLSLEFTKRRVQAYNGSITHFIKSLYEDKLQEQGFEVRRMTSHLVDDTAWNDKKSNFHFYTFNAKGKKVYPPFMVRKVWKDSIASIALPRDSFLFMGPDSVKNILSFNDYLAFFYLREDEPKRYRIISRTAEKNNYQFSKMKILNTEKKIIIQANGRYEPGFDLLFEGYLGWEKVGDSLPLEYVPPDEDNR